MTDALQIIISESKSSVLDKEHNQGSKIPQIASERETLRIATKAQPAHPPFVCLRVLLFINNLAISFPADDFPHKQHQQQQRNHILSVSGCQTRSRFIQNKGNRLDAPVCLRVILY
uniref:Uncharacterized protein n=1 Tax=Salix viminalis TaxID=40686 RepID=A0A6N2LWN6_SALVM